MAELVVHTKAEVLELLRQNGDRIRNFGVSGLGLFGSFVRDQSINPESDVDFLLDFTQGQKTYRNLMDLGYFLEDLLGRKVELVTRESLSPYIGPHILQTVEHVSF
ncbi:MAG: nucleotidyltransferase domain-containing protein [Bacteroidota bacterium]